MRRPTKLVIVCTVAALLGACGSRPASAPAVDPAGGQTIPKATVFAANASSSTTTPSPTSASVAPSSSASPVTVAPTTPAVTTAVVLASPATAPTVAPAPNPCAAYDFRNFGFYLPDYELITVTNGRGVRGSPGVLGYVTLDVKNVVVGDIGGTNGNAEVAVFTVAETGTESRFSDVHIFSCAPSGAVTLVVSAGAGDRAWNGVRGISLSGDTLVIDRFTDDQGACCPGAVARRAFHLVGSKLEPTGPFVLRKFINLDAPAALALTFLSGTSTAALSGTTAKAKPVGLNLFAGQRVKVSMSATQPGQSAAIIDFANGSTVEASVTSGASAVFTASADGYYQFVARAATAGVDTAFDAEVTVGRVNDPLLVG
jgi:hypothetical protein